MKHYIFLFLIILLPLVGWAQESQKLSLPNLEQLSSDHVLHVIQDSEGFLWYATEGGGVCRDDGRQMLVFRSDAEHPDLLGSNDVSCIADAGQNIIIGTFHGAYVLDKHDYVINRLKEVDDKRIDDIIVGSNAHWWLTCNKKVYEYSDEGKILNIYATGDKYIARLHEDCQHRLWASQWDGGLIMLEGNKFKPAIWPLDVAPTFINDDPSSENLLVGTLGKGVVRYNPNNGSLVQTEPTDSLCISRVSLDLQGRDLVCDGFGNCYVRIDSIQHSWFEGEILTKNVADSVRIAHNLSARPTSFAINKVGELWFSTGKDIRRKKTESEDLILNDTKDVSAMTFTNDGTLWLATIFGTLMTYKDGQLVTDDYASNEYGDAVIHIDVDSLGRLILVSDHYVRLYDPVRQTLRQQSREASGTYLIELQETLSGKRWSQPKSDVVEHIPRWVWWTLIILLLVLLLLIYYIWFLHRQRERFLSTMKKEAVSSAQSSAIHPNNEIPKPFDEWLQNAITQVENHLNDNNYGVEQLASDLCMSRMTLYRKIQSSTGQKPTEFIRTIRLRRAADMLREGTLSITEISYDTGFSSVSYFSRCFRTMYGVPPTHFGNTTVADDRLPSENPS